MIRLTCTMWHFFSDVKSRIYLEVRFFLQRLHISSTITAQKMKFSINDFFSKCDQIRMKLRIWSHLLKKSLMENFIFCAVNWDSISKKKIQITKQKLWQSTLSTQGREDIHICLCLNARYKTKRRSQYNEQHFNKNGGISILDMELT